MIVHMYYIRRSCSSSLPKKSKDLKLLQSTINCKLDELYDYIEDMNQQLERKIENAEATALQKVPYSEQWESRDTETTKKTIE